jgi:hypothetical protein
MLLLSDFNQNVDVWTYILVELLISNFMKIRSAFLELLNADRQTDMAKLKSIFSASSS